MIEIPATALILATLLFGFLLGSLASSEITIRNADKTIKAHCARRNAEFELHRHLNLYRAEKSKSARLLAAVRQQRRVMNAMVQQ
jgi:hypothetical protein